MKCPNCGNKDTKVIDSRSLDEESMIRRRRECESCGFRFSTHEDLEILELTVIKKDGSREPYDPEKLETGIKKACEKRPVAKSDIKRFISEVEQDVLKSQKRITKDNNTEEQVIESKKIGEIVMNRLKNFDKVAFIRFASVYRSFADVESFEEELHKLLNK